MTQLLCDVCGHKELVAEITENLIGTECPICSANMLTEEDYKQGLAVFEGLKMLESLGLVRMVSEPTENSFGFNPHQGNLTIRPPKAGK